MKFRKNIKYVSSKSVKVLYMISVEFSVDISYIDDFYDFVFSKTNKEFNTSNKFVLGNDRNNLVNIKFFASLKNVLIDYVSSFINIIDTDKYNVVKVNDAVIVD